MSADHSFSAVNWYPWSKSKKKSSYEISFLSNSKMYINSPVYFVRNTQRHPISLENKTTDFCCVCGKSSHVSLCSHWKKIRLMMWPWHDTAKHIHRTNIQQLWWFTVTPEWSADHWKQCRLDTSICISLLQHTLHKLDLSP